MGKSFFAFRVIMSRNAVDLFAQCQKQGSLGAILIGFEEEPEKRIKHLFDVVLIEWESDQIGINSSWVAKQI